MDAEGGGAIRRAHLCEGFVLGAGALILAGGLAHTFLGWPALRAEMNARSVPPDLMRAAGIGWIFGGTAMDVLGVLTIMSWSMLRSGVRAGRHVAVGAMLSGAAIAWKGRT